jgi:CRISPR-associated endonuclease Cas1
MNPAPVAVANGYAITLTVHRGHLTLSDGIGRQRRTRTWPRIDRTLARVLILGHTGTISLDAMRWCHEHRIAISQVSIDGDLINLTVRPGLDDARLRRAQALAASNDIGLAIARELLGAKIATQAQVTRSRLDLPDLADAISQHATRIAGAASVAECLDLESRAASHYFSAWISTGVRARFIDRDRDTIPAHWHTFTGRSSPIMRGRTPARAVDPVNAILNYLYALAEIEARIALLTVGLDPGIGIVHVDVKARDSLALDLMEVLRPHVDDHVLALLARRPLRRADFHETRDGNCRLSPDLAHELTATMPTWAGLVAPHAERITHHLAASPERHGTTTPTRSTTLTRTNSRAYAAQASPVAERIAKRRPRTEAAPTRQRRVCHGCGTDLYGSARKYCPACWSVTRRDLVRQLGHARAQPTVQTIDAADPAGGITTDEYLRTIQPSLRAVTLADIERATGLTNGSCCRIRSGQQIPNPRHWPGLAALTNAPRTSRQVESGR